MESAQPGERNPQRVKTDGRWYKANKSEEVQMTRNVGRTFLTRPRVPFDELLEEGVPQEHIDLLLEMRRLERERLRENAQAGG
jgi:hypothetical protein